MEDSRHPTPQERSLQTPKGPDSKSIGSLEVQATKLDPNPQTPLQIPDGATVSPIMSTMPAMPLWDRALGPAGYMPAESGQAVEGSTPQRIARFPEVVAEVWDRRLIDALDRAHGGERTGADEAIRLMTSMVLAVVRMRITSKEDVEDTAQEVLVEILNSYENFKGGSIRAWIRTITSRRAIDHFRANKAIKRTAPKNRVPLEKVDVEELDAPVSSGLEHEELFAKLRVAIEQLSEVQQQVVILYYYDGKSRDEISEILSRPPATVKSDLWRATTKLKELLKDAADL